MPFSQQYASTSPSYKLLPLSVIMLCGRPNLTTRSRTNLRAVAPSSFLMGLASIHLVNLSTATSRCVNAHGVICNGPTMSSPRLQTAKLLVLFAILQQEHVVVGHNTGILCMSQPACQRPPLRSASRILAGRLSRPTIGERHDARNLRDGFRVRFPLLLAGKRTLGIP